MPKKKAKNKEEQPQHAETKKEESFDKIVLLVNDDTIARLQKVRLKTSFELMREAASKKHIGMKTQEQSNQEPEELSDTKPKKQSKKQAKKVSKEQPIVQATTEPKDQAAQQSPVLPKIGVLLAENLDKGQKLFVSHKDKIIVIAVDASIPGHQVNATPFVESVRKAEFANPMIGVSSLPESQAEMSKAGCSLTCGNGQLLRLIMEVIQSMIKTSDVPDQVPAQAAA